MTQIRKGTHTPHQPLFDVTFVKGNLLGGSRQHDIRELRDSVAVGCLGGKHRTVDARLLYAHDQLRRAGATRVSYSLQGCGHGLKDFKILQLLLSAVRIAPQGHSVTTAVLVQYCAV